MINQLNQRYALEKSLWNLSKKITETEESIRQAKWNIHCGKVKLTEYESGLRSLLDRFRGTREETLEALSREVRQLEARQTALSRELEGLKEQQHRLNAESMELPTLEELKRSAEQLPEARKLWARLEAALCAEMLEPLLAQTDGALEEYRSQLRGERMGEIVSYERLHEIGTDHIAPARRCAELMERMRPAMEILGEDWEIPGYFRNPEGFIVSAAAQHNRIDRVSQALSHVAAVRKQLEKASLGC